MIGMYCCCYCGSKNKCTRATATCAAGTCKCGENDECSSKELCSFVWEWIRRMCKWLSIFGYTYTWIIMEKHIILIEYGKLQLFEHNKIV